MNKLVGFILFLSLSLISCGSPNPTHIIECSKDKPKSDICALEVKENVNDTSKYIIKKVCGRNYRCTQDAINLNMFGCVDKIMPKEIGEKCQYNEECHTKLCKSGKCEGLEENAKCGTKDVVGYCGHGLACSKKENKCKKLIESEKAGCLEDDLRCQFGYKCNVIDSKDPNKNRCVKLGSIKKGDFASNEMVCETGLMYKNICVSVKTDGTCNADNKCVGLELDGAKYDDQAKYCVTGVLGKNDKENKNYCPLTKTKEARYKEYMKEFDKVGTEKINKDKKTFYDDGVTRYSLGKPELYDLDLLYYNSENFLAQGVINNDGEINKDKKCEMNSILQFLASNRNTINYLFIGLLMGLLI